MENKGEVDREEECKARNANYSTRNPFGLAQVGLKRADLRSSVNILKEIYATCGERCSAISYVIPRMVARTSRSSGDDKSSKRGNSRCFSPGEPRHTSSRFSAWRNEESTVEARWGIEKKNGPRMVSCARKRNLSS